jgi:F-box domain
MDDLATIPYHALPAKPTLKPSTTTDESEPDAKVSSAEREPRDHDTRDHASSQGLNATTLPPEILQHIFSFVEPTSIGRLLCVSRLFNTLLDPAKPLPAASPGVKTLVLQPQNDLWFHSKRQFPPTSGLPRPMEDMSELETWRLIRGTACYFCGKKPKNRIPLLATSPWNAGPGPEGVRAIWPFKTRSCGPCLEARIVKVPLQET